MACDEVIYVVPVGNRLVPASHPMTVFLIVRIAGVIRSAGGRIPAAYVQSMVVHMVLVGPMQMTFVQIVHVLVRVQSRYGRNRACACGHALHESCD